MLATFKTNGRGWIYAMRITSLCQKQTLVTLRCAGLPKFKLRT